jgi:hypothetical protein
MQWTLAEGGGGCAAAAQLDLPLLLKEREKLPGDARVVFYLAQTYDLINDAPNALRTYQDRILMGGWMQEVFESHLRRVGDPLYA